MATVFHSPQMISLAVISIKISNHSFLIIYSQHKQRKEQIFALHLTPLIFFELKRQKQVPQRQNDIFNFQKNELIYLPILFKFTLTDMQNLIKNHGDDSNQIEMKRTGKRNVNHFQPSPDFEKMTGEQLHEEKQEQMQIPDRTLQVTSEHQVNILVQGGQLYDANKNPEILNAYIQPTPNHVRKIAFAATNLLAMFLLINLYMWEPQTKQELAFKNDRIPKYWFYFLTSFMTIIVNLIFHYLIRPERIMKGFHYILLLNVHMMNNCLHVIVGWLISDLGFIILPITIIFLIINSIKVCWDNHKKSKQARKIEKKDNKLMEGRRQKLSHYSLNQSEMEDKSSKNTDGQSFQKQMELN